MRLERSSARDVALGCCARAAWYACDVPCGRWTRSSDGASAAWAGEMRDELDVAELCSSSSRAEDAFEAALIRSGASMTWHVRGRALDAHLERTRDELARLGAPSAVRAAGLGHSAYGSELFPVAFARLRDRRGVREVVGEIAERLMFVYGTASQRAWYREAARWDGRLRVGFRAVNFYTGKSVVLSDSLAGLVTLMHAADILAVLEPERGVVSTAVGFALHLIRVAADMLSAAASAVESRPLEEWASKLRDEALDDVTKRMARLDESSASWSAADVRSLREAAVARAVRRVAETRWDLLMVCRATGVLR